MTKKVHHLRLPVFPKTSPASVIKIVYSNKIHDIIYTQEAKCVKSDNFFLAIFSFFFPADLFIYTYSQITKHFFLA